MADPKGAMDGVPVTLQDAATTGNGSVVAVAPNARQHKVTITGSAGVGAGKIQIESAPTYDYAGTWNPIAGGPITVVVSATIEVNFDGIYQFIRTRVSTDVTGGTVTTAYQGARA